MNPSATYLPIALAVLIGLLVGLEREMARSSKSAMGVRTFTLLGLLGALAGLVDPAIGVVAAVFAFGVIGYAYASAVKSSDDLELGLTSEFAAGTVFCLGYLAHLYPVMVAVIGPCVALLLIAKPKLHGFARELKPSELRAALAVLLMAVLVGLVLDDEALDRWGLFKPRAFGLIVLLLAGLQFASYVLSMIVGERRGRLALGFLGGLVSSTAVTLSNAKAAREAPKRSRSYAASALAAVTASFAELLFLVGMVSPALLKRVIVPGGVAVAVSLLMVGVFYGRSWKGEPEIQVKSPLDIRAVLKLAILLSALIAFFALVQEWLGPGGTLIATFLSALFELHGVSIATATMLESGRLELDTAYLAVMMAMGASLLSKAALAVFVARARFAVYLASAFATIAICVGLAVWYQL